MTLKLLLYACFISGERVACKFDWQTGDPNSHTLLGGAPAAPTTPKPTVPGLPSKLDLIKPLQGRCMIKTKEYWTYEVCLNQRIKQSHGGDIYELGSYSQTDPVTAVQLFDRGTMCDGIGGKKVPRTALVKFACNDGGTESVFYSIEEPAVCSYLATVVTPAVCVDPDFPRIKVTGQIETQQAGPAAADDGHEDWLLQLSESLDGKITCMARSTEVKDSTLFFTKFVVKFDGVAATGQPTVLAR